MEGGLVSRNFRESYVHNFKRKIISSKIKKKIAEFSEKVTKKIQIILNSKTKSMSTNKKK